MPLAESIAELASRVNAWCAEHRVEPANGQAGDLVTERNIRFYRTTGLVDAPESGGGRGFGEKHFLQLVAIRLLQAQGLPLRRIRELLYGRTVAELREVQQRGLQEIRSVQSPASPWPVGDEVWRMTPLGDEFLLMSRRGTALSAAQRAAILHILQSDPEPNAPTSPTTTTALEKP